MQVLNKSDYRRAVLINGLIVALRGKPKMLSIALDVVNVKGLFAMLQNVIPKDPVDVVRAV